MRPSPWARPTTVAALYLAIALAATWPLARVMSTQIAGDPGDTLFNCWVLQWTSGQLLQALHGDVSALARYWNANIFYPAPLTLAYSEHLTPQMLQALPILATTGNIVLAYNVVFLATIVLSGLGMYLLVRDLTNEPLAGFLAGLAFAFSPFRADQFAHLQVLSSQWMPFAFYGLRRFIISGRLRPLIAGSAALLAQGLSCGYYLAYFTPFAVAYCLLEMGARRQLSDWDRWRALAAAAVLLVVGAFLWPYMEVRRFGEVGVRTAVEVRHFSADTLAYATAWEDSYLWGTRIRALPRDEGNGFQGFAILAFAAVGIAAGITRSSRAARSEAPPSTIWRRRAVRAIAVVLVPLLILLVHLLATGKDVWLIRDVVIRYSPPLLMVTFAAAVAAMLVLSPALRRTFRGVRGSPVAGFAWSAAAAAWLSLGPTMYANGRALGPGLYNLFYRWVPAFNGLRVPALNFMIVSFFLSILVGLGAAALLRRWPAAGQALIALGAVAVLAEGLPVTRIVAVPVLDPIYGAVRALPPGAVLAEFPFGDISSEIRHTFLSGFHRRPMINGFSGFFPFTHRAMTIRFARLPDRGQEACDMLRVSGATHVIIHERAYKDDDGPLITAWMERCGGRQLAAVGDDRLFELR
jgi:hypothetical protein